MNSGIEKQQLPPQMPTLEQRITALINQAAVMVFIKGASSTEVTYLHLLLYLLR